MFLQMSSAFQTGNRIIMNHMMMYNKDPEISVSFDQTFDGVTSLLNSVEQLTNNTILLFCLL